METEAEGGGPWRGKASATAAVPPGFQREAYLTFLLGLLDIRKPAGTKMDGTSKTARAPSVQLAARQAGAHLRTSCESPASFPGLPGPGPPLLPRPRPAPELQGLADSTRASWQCWLNLGFPAGPDSASERPGGGFSGRAGVEMGTSKLSAPASAGGKSQRPCSSSHSPPRPKGGS